MPFKSMENIMDMTFCYYMVQVFITEKINIKIKPEGHKRYKDLATF